MAQTDHGLFRGIIQPEIGRLRTLLPWDKRNAVFRTCRPANTASEVSGGIDVNFACEPGSKKGLTVL
jgi:hypothetical protein